MINKKLIGLFVIALLVLSAFTSVTLAGNGKKKSVKNLGIQSASPVTALESSQDVSRRYDIGSINSCKDSTLKRGDTLSFTLDGKKYTLRQGIAGSRYMTFTLMPGSLATRLKMNGYERYDLDSNGIDDLQISTNRFGNGRAYLSICHLE